MPPVLFRDFKSLTAWKNQHDMAIQRVGNRRLTSVVRIRGYYRCLNSGLNTLLPYDQLWARASYRSYASAMKELSQSGFNIAGSDMIGVHADHVINRARLLHLPHTWVKLFPVEATSNAPFGNIERRLPAIVFVDDQIRLSPILFLKLYCGRIPIDVNDLAATLADIRGRLLTANAHIATLLHDMERDALRFLPA
ncbi:hypothetical protein [Aureimonas phyllosphaerae]|uniref:Uncharacterized protein n=1 Tax=Aureimonas phyllosphaerae TaxID=1166078 RepID=A0A7W6BXH2_9HYPH|nr:hypothetical protein [Aureimonas phyllosphaerae]MBB3938210.1 hypothetical protein [Aureimonas phyllosphaerae]MBB3962208.1 hypothetical protein [Aureimonas phyllosphaerae]